MARHRLVIQVDGNIVVVRGWKASGTLRCAGLRATFSGSAGGWMVDAARLPELLAWLDDRRFAYALEGDRPARTTATPSAPPAPEPQAEVGLW
jgi:hypothetical protein